MTLSPKMQKTEEAEASPLDNKESGGSPEEGDGDAENADGDGEVETPSEPQDGLVIRKNKKKKGKNGK